MLSVTDIQARILTLRFKNGKKFYEDPSIKEKFNVLMDELIRYKEAYPIPTYEESGYKEFLSSAEESEYKELLSSAEDFAKFIGDDSVFASGDDDDDDITLTKDDILNYIDLCHTGPLTPEMGELIPYIQEQVEPLSSDVLFKVWEILETVANAAAETLETDANKENEELLSQMEESQVMDTGEL